MPRIKSFRRIGVGLLSAVALLGAVSGAGAAKGVERMRFDRPFLRWGVGGKQQRVAAVSIVNVSGQPFKQALQIEVRERTQREHDLVLSGRTSDKISRDDVLLFSFYVRCTRSDDESALGRLHVAGKANRPSGRPVSLFDKTITAGKEWKHVLIPFEAPVPNKDGYVVSFRLGGTKPQTLQIGKLELANCHDKYDLEQMPATESKYEGMEEDAPWRKAANARIEKYRKGDLEIHVVDSAGRPVPDARVHVVLKRHAYGFGVALGLRNMFSERHPDDAKKYQEAVERLFNKAVFENSMKWKFFKPGDPRVKKAIAWCRERKMPIRGHCMVWADWQRLPKGMEQEYAGRPEAFRKEIERHIREVATAYPDAFSEWDVVNELYTQHTFVDMLGKDVVAEWFRTAKAANPSFKRYINDYAILAGYDQAHRDNYYEWIRYLLDQGAPLDGIGLQGHFRAPVPPAEIYRRLERFARFGLEMQVTEYDFDETDELLQARFTRDFMTVVFSHPQTVGIMTWCLWAKSAWKGDAAFFSEDWKARRMARVWEKMVKEVWHTDETVATGKDGTAKVRGFYGDYEITVSRGGRTATVPCRLEKGRGPLRVEMD